MFDDRSLSLVLAFGATLSFSTSSLVFAKYSHRVSVLWMNAFKASVALIALVATVALTGQWVSIDLRSFAALASSGLLGLNIGDLFLLFAFTRLGVGRTLILFGFQPLFVGIGAYFFFGQQFDPSRLIAVLFLIGCLFIFSLEKYRKEKRWEFVGLFAALSGVALDTCGILLSRGAFDANPAMTVAEGHLCRCLGAVAGFIVISFFRPLRLVEGFRRWPARERTLIVVASLGGTYLSLMLYLSAVKIGHLASIAAVSVTGPVFATALECALHRVRPSRYLVTAFGFFLIGFYILFTTS